jgi:hypothetical protein
MQSEISKASDLPAFNSNQFPLTRERKGGISPTKSLSGIVVAIWRISTPFAKRFLIR